MSKKVKIVPKTYDPDKIIAETIRISEYGKQHDCSAPPFGYDIAKKLFSYLNSHMTPSSYSISGCDGTMRVTKEWLTDVMHYTSDQVDYTLAFLQLHGAFCDCEVLFNAAYKREWT